MYILSYFIYFHDKGIKTILGSSLDLGLLNKVRELTQGGTCIMLFSNSEIALVDYMIHHDQPLFLMLFFSKSHFS